MHMLPIPDKTGDIRHSKEDIVEVFKVSSLVSFSETVKPCWDDIF